MATMSKSAAATAARKGTDLGKPGKGFQAIVSKASKKYGTARAKKIAGAQFWKMRQKNQL